MFEKFKQWAPGKQRSLRQDQRVLSDWAKGQGRAPTPVVGHAHGLVVEWPTLAGRLEWGPSQRPYIPGQELRWRAEGVPGKNAQMVCLSKALARQFEVEVFDQITGENQTVVDPTLPDEVRWLVMLPKISLNESAGLNARFAVMCSHEPLVSLWRDPRVLQALLVASESWWTDGLPCVLTHNNGWLTLRMPAQGLTAADLDDALALFSGVVQALKARSVGV